MCLVCPDGPFVLATREGADGTRSTVGLDCAKGTASSAGREIGCMVHMAVGITVHCTELLLFHRADYTVGCAEFEYLPITSLHLAIRCNSYSSSG